VKPALCIVVPVVDEGPILAMHLGELQRFRKRGARAVVVDGGSSDSSLAIAAGLADLVVVAPQGRARQMNAGAAVCTADLLMSLHADTRLPKNADEMDDVALSALPKRHDPPACLRERVTTSARRRERHGPWRTILLMWRLRAAYFLGADPAKLALRCGYRAPLR